MGSTLTRLEVAQLLIAQWQRLLAATSNAALPSTGDVGKQGIVATSGP
jgi:hypothetical protein